ncbi:MAG: TonB-dependent receptor [Deltaproteobacteria bacterium]|nr:TonB-dependent receptor [Deltaproteobacteria bacterium]
MAIVASVFLAQPAAASQTSSVAFTRTATPAAVAPRAEDQGEVPKPEVLAPVDPEIFEVVVTGSRTDKRLADTPVVTELITRNELKGSGAENLGEILEEHPGVQLERSSSGTSIRLQGLNPEQVLLLVDGERVAGRVRGGLDPTRFDLENVEQVEIVKGAASALYGSDAMGGVINVIPRRPRLGASADLRATYGSFNTLDAMGAAAYRNRRAMLQLSGGYHRTDGFDLSPNDEVTTAPAYGAFNLAANGAYEPDQETRLRFRGDYRRNDLTAVDLVPPRALIDRDERIESFSFSAGPELKLEGPARLKVSLYYSLFRQQIASDQRGGREFDAQEDNRQRTAQATVQYDRVLFDDHFVTLGVDGLEELQEVAFLDEGLGRRRRGAVFLQDEWTVLRDDLNLVIVPGLRFDSDSQFGSRPSPKLAVRFDPTDWIVLRGSYAWGFRAPSFEELYLRFVNAGSGYRINGNPDLLPETSQNASLDAELNPTSFLVLRLGGYFNDIRRLIDTIRVPAPPGGLNLFQYGNITSARTMGLEAGLRLTPLNGLVIDLGYDLTETLDRTLDRPLPGRARHRGTLRVQYREPELGLLGVVRGAWVSSRPFFGDLNSDGQDDVGAPYATLDLRIAKELFTSLELGVGLENLLDEGDPTLLPIPPRSFFVSLAGRYAGGRLDDGP